MADFMEKKIRMMVSFSNISCIASYRKGRRFPYDPRQKLPKRGEERKGRTRNRVIYRYDS